MDEKENQNQGSDTSFKEKLKEVYIDVVGGCADSTVKLVWEDFVESELNLVIASIDDMDYQDDLRVFIRSLVDACKWILEEDTEKAHQQGIDKALKVVDLHCNCKSHWNMLRHARDCHLKELRNKLKELKTPQTGKKEPEDNE